MNRIVDNIFVGTVDDIPLAQGFSILGCCKEPLHRKHAKLQGSSEEGYIGRAMPKHEPEYLWAKRDHALYLNLIDAREEKYIPDEIIFRSMVFIGKELLDNRNILIVCNKAESRSPSIAFMWMMTQEYFKDIENFEDAKNIFTNEYYPFYKPSKGFEQYTKKFWRELRNGKT